MKYDNGNPFQLSQPPSADRCNVSTLIDAHALALLCHQTSDGLVVSGVAALAVMPSTPFTRPGALAAHLSRLLADVGDVALPSP